VSFKPPNPVTPPRLAPIEGASAAAFASARAPAPPPPFPALPPAGSTVKIVNDSHALHPGHCPCHCP
jgi:hypothetical protein